MKNLIVIFVLSLSSVIYAQDSLDGLVVFKEVKETSVDISMTVDNFEELENFKPEELRENLEELKPEEKLTFKLTYEYPESKKDGKSNRSFSYKIEGKSNDIDAFIKSIDYIQNAAKKVVSR